jgi:capsular polysaccharide export protein
MGQKIAVLTSGMWRLRPLLRAASGLEPVRWDGLLRRPRFDAIAGWGHRPSTAAARQLACRTGLPFVAFEDGWLRSIEPGQGEAPLSLLVDRSGVHYDARHSSDLEATVVAACGASWSDARARRAEAAMALLRARRLSKYNAAPELSRSQLGLDARPAEERVLVVDQTYGDGAIDCGLADEGSFARMLHAAVRENPRAEILVKTHPEVVSGRKRGYLSGVSGDRIRLIDRDVNPWSLLEVVGRVYTVTSQMGLDGLIAGRNVTCFGAPFYAGWGLTDDRVAVPRRTARPSLGQLFAALYFDYARYVCPRTHARIEFEDAALGLLALRQHHAANSLARRPMPQRQLRSAPQFAFLETA